MMDNKEIEREIELCGLLRDMQNENLLVVEDFEQADDIFNDFYGSSFIAKKDKHIIDVLEELMQGNAIGSFKKADIKAFCETHLTFPFYFYIG